MKVLIAGDFCPILRIEPYIASEDYETIFGEVKPIIEQADCSILNLECPVLFNRYKPIPKCGPNLHCDIGAIKSIKYLGFNVLSLANNHIMDYGEEGLKDTMQACEQMGIRHTGAGNNLESASKVLYYKIKDKVLAIINCCEHEFSIADDNKPGANPLNPIMQYYAIKEARNNSDYVLVIVHGGHEHYQLPSQRMIDTYRFFVDLGADAVINHHQHCYSGYEIYNGKPIFYGIGNFCFDHKDFRNNKWNEGYMVIINFNEEITYQIIPYIQNSDKAGVSLVSYERYAETISQLNDIIKNKDLSGKHFQDLVNSRKAFNDFIFEPYDTSILKKLFFRNIMPRIYPSRKKLLLENIVNCESHRDILLSYFKMQNK